MPPSPRISVVSPVYNSAPFLPAFVDSFLEQSLGPGEIELIAVDDGSTDGSGALLDEYAHAHENISVIHQENSGWPGRPRNVGLEAARGDYVFFADPDDEFGGPEALARLADFADEHRSDVVLPRMVPKGNRQYAQWRYARTQVDADLVTCFTTLTPQKLFRRSLLTEHDIRFPEGKVRLEDGQFLSRAYLLATRVSILTGYDFYHLVRHPGQSHLTNQAPDPANYIGSVGVICENVEQLCPDADTADRIIDEVYVRKVLANFNGSRLANHAPERREAWLKSQREFVDRFITSARYDKLDDVARLRTDLVRNGDLDAIVAYARAGQVDFAFTSATSRRGTVELRGTVTPAADDARIVVVDRDDPEHRVSLPLAEADGEATVSLPKEVLPHTAGTRRFDLWIDPGPGQQERRIRGPEKPFSTRFTGDRNIEVYTTKHGNLSIAVRRGLTVTARLARRVRRLLPR